MCGRFTNVLTWGELVKLYRLTADRPALNLPARYNIAPTQDIPIVRLDGAGGRELVMARWGLVPRWAEDIKIGYKLINARAETVDEKPSFKDAFRRRRCLIPATGYFEWKTTATGKQPYLFAPAEGGAWSFAGLWERNDRAGQAVESCTIIVGPANDLAREIHDRMPVILDAAEHETWLGSADPGAIKALLRPYPAVRMRSYPVSTRVGNVRNDDADLIQEISI
ncbi:MAG: SOS response-associated peptidase [Phycisphaerales bacterium]|jgi:putative SOS response-associated peptidase YedK